MSYDPRHTVNHAGTDPNKGMRTQPYMVSLLVALLVLLGVILFLVKRSSQQATPTHSTSPASSAPAAGGNPH